jgi:hypothetical protein
MGPENSKTHREENEDVDAADIQVELGQTSKAAETRTEKKVKERHQLRPNL